MLGKGRAQQVLASSQRLESLEARLPFPVPGWGGTPLRRGKRTPKDWGRGGCGMEGAGGGVRAGPAGRMAA